MIFQNRRGEIEILDSMLSEAMIKVKKTRLMHQANVCYSQFSDYFEFLIAQGFLSVAADDFAQKTYVITEKGQRFHESIKAILFLTKGKSII